MDIELHPVTIREVVDGYTDDGEGGVFGYGDRLNIRPPYQRRSAVRQHIRPALGAQLGELVTDRLDTPSQTFLVLVTDVLVDIPHDQRCGRSSSAAKKADALLRIALARLSSAFSRFNRFSSADSSLVVPTRCPASTSA